MSSDKLNNDKLQQLEQKLIALEQALAQLISDIQGIKALAQTPPPQPQPQQQQQFDPSMVAALAPLLQTFMQPKSSELEKLLVQNALQAFLTQASVSQKFLETIMEALAASFGKKSGEAIAKKIVLME